MVSSVPDPIGAETGSAPAHFTLGAATAVGAGQRAAGLCTGGHAYESLHPRSRRLLLLETSPAGTRRYGVLIPAARPPNLRPRDGRPPSTDDSVQDHPSSSE